MSHRTADFDYHLPDELIAQAPLADRGASRLLVVRREGRPSLEDRTFQDLVSLIPAGDLLVLNTTRVLHARLPGTRPSGRPAEVLLLHPAPDGTWVAMGKPGSAMRPGSRVHLAPGVEVETVALLPDGYRSVRLIGATPGEAMARFGRLPLPPYITRDPDDGDELRYQTVYSEREASVAAPTAGLHFTPDLLQRLEQNGVVLAKVELEVGPGTFKPVDADDPARHPMHPERFAISEAAARAVADARRRGARVWAVGTTVVRALESAATGKGEVSAGAGETRLMITPGFRFQVVDRLVTNFHLPRSTLIMLVAGFAGLENTLAAYHHAVEARYRFYSYGDAMLVL